MSRHTLFFLILILGSAVVAAQNIELTETQLFESGASFNFPEDWSVEANEGSLIVVASDLTRVTLADYAHFEDSGVAATGQNKSLTWYFNQATQGEVAFNAGDVEEIELGERSALRYDYEYDSGNAGLMLLVRFSDGGFGIVDSVSLDGDMQEEDVVLAIAESFDSGEAAEGGESQAGASTGVPCTVSTNQERTVRVRVGPGENRTSYTFLPANQSFEVLGQATADDDSLWWKLDRETVAPNAAANEAWVAQDDVEAEGDCEAVVDVNAPPIIPIVSEPPPGSGEQPSGGEDGTTTEGSISPTPGSWTISFARSAPASCLGSETVHIPLNIPPMTFSLTGGGNAIVYGGDRLTLRQPNVYGGLFDVPVGGTTISAEIILRVHTASYMTGEIIFTEVLDDTACSITVPVTVTRN
jgi:hypothetical protein